MSTLKEVAQKVVDELLSTGIPPSERHTYAPHLVALGENLQAAILNTPEFTLREDVKAFAQEMSAMMDLKQEEKDQLPHKTLIVALQQIQTQWQKFQNFELPPSPEIIKAMIHIANWAMIGRQAVEQGRIFK